MLAFTENLHNEIQSIAILLQRFIENPEIKDEIAAACKTVGQLLIKGLEIFFPMFNHIIAELFTVASVV